MGCSLIDDNEKKKSKELFVPLVSPMYSLKRRAMPSSLRMK